MVKLVKEIQAGTWKPSHVRGDLKDGSVVLDPFGPAVADGTRMTILAKKDEILSGKFVVWSGPMMGQDGKEILAAGKPMSMEMLESMNFFVQGVIGTIK
jgi:basic membrane protein A and related proteins